jgi:hypothetical protein
MRKSRLEQPDGEALVEVATERLLAMRQLAAILKCACVVPLNTTRACIHRVVGVGVPRPSPLP